MPLENAFAFSWWLPNFLMMMAVYFFIFHISKSIFLSISSSLMFFFTPFNHWWSFQLAFYLGYGLFFLLFFIKSLENKKVKSFLLLIISLYFFICYVFITYPPFQIATFYVLFSFLLGYLISKKILFNKKTIIYGLIIFLLTSFIIAVFYFEFKDIIKIIRNTVYPGKRFVANTLGDFLFLINGFYNIQLLDDVKGTGPFTNQSEASNFFLISFFALPIYWLIIFDQIRKKKIDYIFLLLNLVFFILLLWFLFPIPSLIAKISLLYLVLQNRTIIGIGIVSYLLMFYYLAKIKPKKDFFYFYLTLLCTLIIFFVNLYLGFWFKFNYPVFIQNSFKIILISLISSFLMYFLLIQKTKLFLILLLIFSFFSTYRVNPLYRGLDPLINTPLAKELRKIDKDYGGKYRWLLYGSIYLENYFIANGLKSLNGTYFYPQFSLWHKFDKERKYENIYNRYVHVTLLDDPTKEKFILHSPDHFSFNLNPCENKIKINYFKFFLFEREVNYFCLQLLKEVNNFYIYKNY